MSYWVTIGVLGQACFFMRFFVQWIASERKGESVIPVQFWYLSIVGSLILLAYSIHQNDPVFILGQSTGTVIYLRNLALIYKRKPKQPGQVNETACSQKITTVN